MKRSTTEVGSFTNVQQVFSETKGSFLEGLKKPVSVIIQVRKSRSEGMGLNAACRVFEIAKNTLLDWERRFADMKESLMVYALMCSSRDLI